MRILVKKNLINNLHANILMKENRMDMKSKALLTRDFKAAGSNSYRMKMKIRLICSNVIIMKI